MVKIRRSCPTEGGFQPRTLPINPRHHDKRQKQEPVVADTAVILDIEKRQQAKR